jgi:IclR family acetate operon transcriptional repressor
MSGARPMANEAEFKRTRGRPRSDATAKSASTVQALDRAMILLTTLARQDEARLTDLAASTDMAASTAHRILMTLETHGIVAFDENSQNWSVGVEAFRIGSSFTRRVRVADVGRGIMRELMEKTGETANLAIADDDEVVFVSQVETHAAIRAFFRPGTRGLMHASGIGKALLSEYTDAAVARVIARRGLTPFTPKTLTSTAALMADLAATRARGWSIDDEERNIGMRCLAAPIYDANGEAMAGVSISGPTVRMTDGKIAEFGPYVADAARRISELVGGRAPR